MKKTYQVWFLLVSLLLTVPTLAQSSKSPEPHEKILVAYEQLGKSLFGIDVVITNDDNGINYWAMLHEGKTVVVIRKCRSYTTAFVRGPKFGHTLTSIGRLENELSLRPSEFAGLIKVEGAFKTVRISNEVKLNDLFDFFDDIFFAKVPDNPEYREGRELRITRKEALKFLTQRFPSEFWWAEEDDILKLKMIG